MEYNQPLMTMPVTTAGYDQYNNGAGMWMNNPFAYLIWIYALRWMGGFGYGNFDQTGADRSMLSAKLLARFRLMFHVVTPMA